MFLWNVLEVIFLQFSSAIVWARPFNSKHFWDFPEIS